jgi:hypothetical protein
MSEGSTIQLSEKDVAFYAGMADYRQREAEAWQGVVDALTTYVQGFVHNIDQDKKFERRVLLDAFNDVLFNVRRERGR